MGVTLLAQGSTFGKFRILGALGRGGMGPGCRAADDAGREVALKLGLPGRIGDAAMLRRFKREARAARAVHHPNVIGLVDEGEVEGVVYLAFELAPGGS